MQLQISEEYLTREAQHGKFVNDWIEAYCKRNSIVLTVINKYGEDYWNLAFRSQHQLDCFVRIGNQNYPYFEFR